MRVRLPPRPPLTTGATMKVYGPYLRRDGRKHVVIVHDDGRKQTKSYPRLLMEQHLGRELLPEETVDHINNDKTDDRIENLQILSLAENARKQMALCPRKMHTFTCPNCGVNGTTFLNYVKRNKKQGKAGPFCSRSCAGKFTYVDHWATSRQSGV